MITNGQTDKQTTEFPLMDTTPPAGRGEKKQSTSEDRWRVVTDDPSSKVNASNGQTKNHSLYYWVKWYHAVRKIRGMFENWKVSILYRLFPFCIKSPVEKFLWKVNVSPYIILSHLLSNKGSDSHIYLTSFDHEVTFMLVWHRWWFDRQRWPSWPWG